MVNCGLKSAKQCHLEWVSGLVPVGLKQYTAVTANLKAIHGDVCWDVQQQAHCSQHVYKLKYN